MLNKTITVVHWSLSSPKTTLFKNIIRKKNDNHVYKILHGMNFDRNESIFE